MVTSSGNWQESRAKRVLLDCGAYELKYSLATESKPHVVYNAAGRNKKTGKVYLGNKLREELDKGAQNLQITHPMIRGLLQDSDLQQILWKQEFQKSFGRKFDAKQSCLCLAVQPNVPDVIQERLCEMVFEDLEFDAMSQVSSHAMVRGNAIQEQQAQNNSVCQIVVDSGFSFTTIVPFFNGVPLRHASTRIDVGGKILTNLLAENLSYKEINLKGETHLVNNIKEQTCYVSSDFSLDMKNAKAKLQEYVLPDFKTIKKGFVRTQDQQLTINNDDNQIVKMTNDRFAVPEILFNPADIGINQAGIPEAILQTVEKCPPAFHRQLYGNIILAGGNANFPGFAERVRIDLERLRPVNYQVGVQQVENATLGTWRGLKQFASASQDNGFRNSVLTRSEYQEEGGVRAAQLKFII